MQNVEGCGSILDKYFDVDTMSIHIKEKNPILKKNGSPDGRKSIICEETLDKKAVNTLIDEIFMEIEERED
jgi:predicted PilT family ATPase